MYYLPAADRFIQCSNYFSQVCSSRYFVFCRFCLGSLFSTVSFKIKYFKQVSVHLEIPISSVPAEFGCDTKMPLYCSWKYLCFKCIWLCDKKPSRFVAELCYSGWYMGCSVQFPIIFLGKNVMAWSHSQEQSKLVLESWRFMWMYSTTSTRGSKVTCQSRQLFAFANYFSSGFVTHRFFFSCYPCGRSSGFWHNGSFFMFQGILALLEGVFPQIQ